MSNIKNALVTIFLLALGLVELTACSTTVNPAYGESRSQLLLIPEETINEAQAEAYEEDKNEAGDNLNSDTKFTKPSRKAPSFSYGDIRNSQKI